MKKLLLSLAVMLAGASISHAATYSWTAVTNYATSSAALTEGGWTLTTTVTDTPYTGYDGTKGIQLGSSGKPETSVTLTSGSTSPFSGEKITKVVVNASGASSIAATMTVKVGDTQFTPASVTLTSTATDYTFTGEATGDVEISITQTSSKAIYLKSIQVSYGDGNEDPGTGDGDNSDEPIYTWTAATNYATSSAALTEGGWTLTTTVTDTPYTGYDATKGIQLGSSGKPEPSVTLTSGSTSPFSGEKITKVVVNASGASSIAATMTVKVGDTQFTPASVTLTSTATDYTFTGEATGDVEISITQTSSKAIYLKSIQLYNGENSGESPEPPTPSNMIYEGLNSNMSDWTTDNIELGSLTYVWSWDSYKYAKGSAYKNGAVEAESYLVSPLINLTERKNATLTFEQAINFLNSDAREDVANVCVKEGGSEVWNNVTVDTWPVGNSWTFNTSTVDLSSYVGKSIYIGFKYNSSSSNAITWEIKNVVITGDKDIDAAVEGIEAEEGEAVYYNLQGVRVANPERGIYIRVSGKKAEKVLFK